MTRQEPQPKDRLPRAGPGRPGRARWERLALISGVTETEGHIDHGLDPARGRPRGLRGVSSPRHQQRRVVRDVADFGFVLGLSRGSLRMSKAT